MNSQFVIANSSNPVTKDASGQLVTTSLAIAEGTKVQHKNVMELVRKYLADLDRFGGVAFETLPFETAGGDQEREVAILNEPQAALVIAFMRNTDIVIEFKVALIKEFFDMRSALSKPIVLTYPQALRQLADETEAKELAQEIARIAIETKAEIGNRREATAMNTASQATKKVTALQIELDQSKLFSSVKRMQMIYHGQKFDWRKLKSAAQEMHSEPIDIFDSNYGTVKSYHADVWLEVYALPIDVTTESGVPA